MLVPSFGVWLILVPCSSQLQLCVFSSATAWPALCLLSMPIHLCPSCIPALPCCVPGTQGVLPACCLGLLWCAFHLAPHLFCTSHVLMCSVGHEPIVFVTVKRLALKLRSLH